MPVKEPQVGKDRSGRGTAVPAFGSKPQKNWDAPRYPWMHNAGATPSADADSMVARTYGFSDEEAFQGGDDVTVKYPNRLAAMNKRDNPDNEETFAEVRILIQMILREEKEELLVSDEDEDVDLPEVSTMGGGAVAGYTGPLGAGAAPATFPGKKKKK